MATDYFLKIDGIEGESVDAVHAREIEILAWTWGAAHPSSSSTIVPGERRAEIQDFSFTMPLNKSSAKLLLACVQGTRLKMAALTCRRGDGKQMEYLKFRFRDVIVSSFQTASSSDGHGYPIDNVTLSFARFEVDYFQLKEDGSPGGKISEGWDISQNKQV
jgi:type VI secretion system secreted protein Hcp